MSIRHKRCFLPLPQILSGEGNEWLRFGDGWIQNLILFRQMDWNWLKPHFIFVRWSETDSKPHFIFIRWIEMDSEPHFIVWDGLKLIQKFISLCEIDWNRLRTSSFCVRWIETDSKPHFIFVRWMAAVTPAASQVEGEKIYEDWDCPKVDRVPLYFSITATSHHQNHYYC